jgi:hypothetical protein
MTVYIDLITQIMVQLLAPVYTDAYSTFAYTRKRDTASNTNQALNLLLHFRSAYNPLVMRPQIGLLRRFLTLTDRIMISKRKQKYSIEAIPNYNSLPPKFSRST